ncbi:NAD-dependent epimerase/dehydratase family protein [Pelagibacteraceae bacterium]|nr:NAD-dependent epimerase/dehydratase family protein [Pelagibacteraceae bacterium]
MNKNSSILIIGFPKYLGLEIYNSLKLNGYKNLIFKSNFSEKNQNNNYLSNIFIKNKFEFVFLLGGDYGGIAKNIKKPATLMYSNLMLSTNIINLSYKYNVKKLINLSSSCVYPSNQSKPLKPSMLLQGPVEKTSQPYSISKISSLELCKAYKTEFKKNFITIIPSTIYGPKDKFFSNDAHVIPSLISKFYLAHKNNKKKITLWGSGNPIRDFIYYKDLAEGIIFVMKKYNENQPINISTNEKISIKNLANKIKIISKYKGKIIFNRKLEGSKYKTLDISKIKKFGWKHKTSLEKGLEITYQGCSKQIQ